MKVFVSYSHAQLEWVMGRLEPCLRAGGAQILIDRQRFEAGRSLIGQMDALQDQADRQVLILSKDYLSSGMCCHEMDRAVALDPAFTQGHVIPVRRDDCAMPAIISGQNPLYADLRDDTQAGPWNKLMMACDIGLGMNPPDWLSARDDVLRSLQTGRSVNLITRGTVAWRGLLDDLASKPVLQLAQLDLDQGETSYRQGFVEAVLAVLGMPGSVPRAPRDLAHLSARLATLKGRNLAIRHTDHIGRTRLNGGCITARDHPWWYGHVESRASHCSRLHHARHHNGLSGGGRSARAISRLRCRTWRRDVGDWRSAASVYAAAGGLDLLARSRSSLG